VRVVEGVARGGSDYEPGCQYFHLNERLLPGTPVKVLIEVKP